jgi:MoxR-like ATPase
MNNVVEVSHDELARQIIEFYFDKEPLMIWGPPGCGKSETALVANMAIAKILNRNFVRWVSNKETQERLFNDPEYRKQSYIYIDMRLSQKDAVEFSGIPDLDKDKGYAAWRPQLAYATMSREGAAGIFFYDEITKSTEAVKKAAYQTINDRGAGEVSFAADVSVLAAGNRVEDGCGDAPMDPALSNRFCHMLLLPASIEAWLEYARNPNLEERAEALAEEYVKKAKDRPASTGLDERIRAFMFHKPDLHAEAMEQVKKNKNPSWASPRSWSKASKLISGLPHLTENDLNAIYIKVASAVGSGIANLFRAFLVSSRKVNIPDLLDNPEGIVSTLDAELACSLIWSIPAYYKKNKGALEKILNLINYVGTSGFTMDILTEVLHIIRVDNKADFDKRVIKCNNKNVLIKLAPLFKDLEG